MVSQDSINQVLHHRFQKNRIQLCLKTSRQHKRSQRDAFNTNNKTNYTRSIFNELFLHAPVRCWDTFY